MSAEYKSVNITGGAVADLGLRKKRTRKSKGGSDEQERVEVPKTESYKNVSITKIGGSALMPLAAPFAPPLVKPPQPQPQSQSQPLQPSQTMQGGKDTAHKITVKLHKKSHSKKVTLHPKKEAAKEAPKTKKARKFVLGISSMHKRMTRAKKMQHKFDKMPLVDLRKHLIGAGLIKSASKAPESILRQIAKDSQLVGENVL